MIATSLQNRGYPKPKTQKIKSIFDEAKKSGKEGFLNFFIFQNLNLDIRCTGRVGSMWKFQDFSASQILREVNFGHFVAPKNCLLTI